MKIFRMKIITLLAMSIIASGGAIKAYHHNDYKDWVYLSPQVFIALEKPAAY
ncbi:MAG: hypothetical protein AB2421_10835 [Thermotaleaceae bacterium]